MPAQVIQLALRQLRTSPPAPHLHQPLSGAYLFSKEHVLTDDHSTNITPHGVLLLGRVSGRTRAAAFAPEDAALATKAAQLMGLRTLALDDDMRVALANRASRGKIFKSGSGFVPFCSQELYRQACALGGFDPDEELQRFDPERVDEEQVALSEGPLRLPLQWNDLGPGCVCLASEGPGHGWFEAIVIEAADDFTLRLRWKNFSEATWGRFERRPDQLALLPPAAAETTVQAGESEAVCPSNVEQSNLENKS